MAKNERPRSIAEIFRIALIIVWLGLIAACLTAYIYDPGSFSPQNLAFLLSRFQAEIWIVYILISAVRGFTLLPSTPVVIAGTIIFPDDPFLVLIVSILGILFSSSMIYFFSDRLGFRHFFEKHGDRKLELIKARLEHTTGVAFVVLWSFFPFVPTDLVCYVAGIVRMNFLRFISAIFVGEIVLCTLYVFVGRTVIELIP